MYIVFIDYNVKSFKHDHVVKFLLTIIPSHLYMTILF